MSNINELIIIEKILAGDVSLYGQFVERYKNLALTLAYNIVLNKEDAEEIAQDAFVKAFSSLHTFKGVSKFSTWFYRIVLNTSLNKRKLRRLQVTTMNDDSLEEIPQEITTIANLRNGEQSRYIKMAMRNMNENERICITMYYLNELSVEEISELTNFSTSNIKVLLHRGRKSLCHQLQHLLKEEVKNLI